MLTIDPEFKSLIPPLTPEERAGLEDSIAREGCRDPLVTWGETILDGHNRYAICKSIGKPYATVPAAVSTRDEAKAWIIRNQFARRNLSPWQRAELALRLEPILKSAAEARMLAGKPADPSQNSDQGRVLDQIAERAGLSADTIHKARFIRDKADPAVLDALRAGETTVSREYGRLKNPGLLYASFSNDWFTPSTYVEAARRVLGEIDLDPASCTKANGTVRAAKFYDEEINGLVQDWPGRVWLNPPYGGLAGPFTEKLIAEYRAGRTSAAIILVNAQATPTKWFQGLWDFPLCFPDHRIEFESDRMTDPRCTHGSVFAYLGPHEDRFVEVFSAFGPVVKRIDVPAAAVARHLEGRGIPST